MARASLQIAPISEGRDTAAPPAISSGVLVFSGTAVVGQLVGVIAAVLGACMVLAWWRPTVSIGGGPSAVIIVMISGLWTIRFFFAEMPPISAILLGSSLPLIAVGEIGPISQMSTWKKTLIRLAATALDEGHQ